MIKRYRIFYKLEENLEIPMFILAILWLYLFVVELISGLTDTQQDIIFVIWILFIIEFLLKLALAPRRSQFLKNNWITAVALLIPAIRILRVLRALRLLRSVRVVNSTRIIRALTSGKRFFGALKEAQGPAPKPQMDVGILIAYHNFEIKDDLIAYAELLSQDVKNELENSTGIPWTFDLTESFHLENDRTRSPTEYLDRASMAMAEGPYDIVAVITDVGLMSRKNSIVPGLSSPVARIMVISTRKLISTGKKQAELKLNDSIVRHNSAALLLRQVGLMLGLKTTNSTSSKIMSMEVFNQEQLYKSPSFTGKEREILKKKAKKAPDRELQNGNDMESFIFHILMTFRHLKIFIVPLLQSRALLLPLSLPGLATAAVAPAIILIFSAEIWDVGLGMSNGTAAVFAIISIMTASFYLVRVQSLFLPRKEKRILTEHLAVANSVIYFSIFLACIGLFLLVGGLTMIIELYVFPQDLMKTWPTLNRPEIFLSDKIRLAVFISTIGVTTGALAGGLESRKIVQQLALFRNKV